MPSLVLCSLRSAYSMHISSHGSKEQCETTIVRQYKALLHTYYQQLSKRESVLKFMIHEKCTWELFMRFRGQYIWKSK